MAVIFSGHFRSFPASPPGLFALALQALQSRYYKTPSSLLLSSLLPPSTTLYVNRQTYSTLKNHLRPEVQKENPDSSAHSTLVCEPDKTEQCVAFVTCNSVDLCLIEHTEYYDHDCFGHEKRWTPSRLVTLIKKRLSLGRLKAGRWEGRLRDHAANMQAAGTGQLRRKELETETTADKPKYKVGDKLTRSVRKGAVRHLWKPELPTRVPSRSRSCQHCLRWLVGTVEFIHGWATRVCWSIEI
jgi:hypothetical protein